MRRHAHRRHRPHRRRARRARCRRAATRSRCSRATPTGRARRSGVEAARLGPARRARRRPRRWPGATRSSTSRARTSPSAGPTRPSARSATRARSARATSSPACAAAEPRPRVLVCASAVGYYGPHGDEPVDRVTPPGDDFLAEVVRRLGARGARRRASSACASSSLRTGVVLDRDGGALAKMLPLFKLGVGGPVAGGAPVHALDPRRRRRRPLPRRARRRATGAARQRQRARARSPTGVLARRSAARCTAPPSRPCPAFALALLYGDMAEIVTDRPARGARARARARLRLPRTPTSTRRCADAAARTARAASSARMS